MPHKAHVITSDDPMHMVKTITVALPTWSYAVSNESLLYAHHPSIVWEQVVKEFGQAAESALWNALQDLGHVPGKKEAHALQADAFKKLMMSGTVHHQPSPPFASFQEMMETIKKIQEKTGKKPLLLHDQQSFTEFAHAPLIPYDPQADSHSVLAVLTKGIPGFNKMRVKKCPAPAGLSGGDCQEFSTGDPLLSNVIIHLNDHHQWARERIADWLDTLDLDLSFKKTGKEVIT